MKTLLIIYTFLVVISCSPPQPQKATIIKLKDIKSMMESQPEKLQVINFWATWCKPCVDELPAFEKLQSNYGNEIDVVLISLDDVENLESKVNPFLEKNNIQSQVRLLDHDYAAEYIPLVDPHWDGAIPVTLIKYKNDHKFFNKTFDYKELKTEVMALLDK